MKKKKAIILDLDNTIYPVHSISEKLFPSLLELIKRSGKHDNDIQKIKYDIMRKPFQVVAATYRFSDDLTQQGIALLKDLSYEEAIETFDDYKEVKNIPLDRYLVTTGFTKLQSSKIKQMGIKDDFKEVVIVDPETTDLTKKDVFADIMRKNGYKPEEVLVVGDDLYSEIKAARELNIDAVLYDKYDQFSVDQSTVKISNFRELLPLIGS
jgi:putative hydrolase of the HAD superfamily